MKKYRDINGDLKYICWKYKWEFNFKAMFYIEHNKCNCPNCETKIKLQRNLPLRKVKIVNILN